MQNMNNKIYDSTGSFCSIWQEFVLSQKDENNFSENPEREAEQQGFIFVRLK